MVKNVQQFAIRLEEEFLPQDDKGMWRQCWVTPANLSSTGKKEYNFEKPSASAEQIVSGVPKADPSKTPHPGRGYKTKPKWALGDKNDPTGDLHKALPAISIYLKFVKDLFVVDFDTMEKCQYDDKEDEGVVIDHNPLFRYLVDSQTPYVETAKGYHFYVLIGDCPEFSSGLKCAIDPDIMGDVDIIGRKGCAGEKNIIEQCHHPLTNGDAPIHRIHWDEFKEFINVSVFFGENKGKDKSLTRKEKIESASIFSGNNELPEEQFLTYLSRLRKTDHLGDDTKKSRWHYLEYVKVGMVCWTNFSDKDVGFTIWMNWVRSDPDVAIPGHDHSKRSIAVLQGKWVGFSECENPLTWKTLRQWANEDDPIKNIYQEIYDQGGLGALTTYMNSFLAYNKKTTEYLFDDPDDISEYASLTFYTPANAMETWCAREVCVVNEDTGKVKFVNPFLLWKKNGMRKEVCGVQFDPSPTAPKNYYNLFQGFLVDKNSTEDLDLIDSELEVKPLLDHLLHVWCKGNRTFYDFVLNWFAFVLQRPHHKIGVLLCVKSKEGGGKGIVFEFMKKILGGRLMAQINSLDAITGKNNAVLEGRLLINGDEIVWGGDIKAGNAMKGIITEQEIWIEEKYRARYKIKNTTAFCFSSNEDRAMSSREGDRRSFGLELSDEWCGRQKTPAHKKYFSDISGCTHHGCSQEKVLAFANLLYNRDLTSFDLRNPPMTEFVSDQIERNMSAVQKFWYGMLNAGRFTIDPKYKKSTPNTIETEYGPKTTWEPYDDAQLEYGNVSKKFGSGMKDVEDIYSFKEPKVPVYGYAYYPYSDYTKDRDRYWSPKFRGIDIWFSILDHIVKENLYPGDMPPNLSIIPPPEWLVSSFGGSEHTYDKMPCATKGYSELSETGKYSPAEHSTHLDEVYPTGFHSGCIQPEGVKPQIRRSQQNGCPDMFFKASACRPHIANLLLPGSYQQIIKNRDNQEGIYEDYFEQSPVNYYRKSVPFAEMKSGQVTITDQLALVVYLDKWSKGVNPTNFHVDLVGTPFFDDEGNQMFQTDHTERHTRWVYDKDWVFERYKESTGVGYGQDNVDVSAFWKSICEMLGGEQKTGGKYRSFRLREESSRKSYLKIVPLAIAREEFCKNAGRLVKWQDDEEGDEEVYEW